ncbi:MAG TPA: FHA domain-containing protein, partial [Acidobacteria bacterium]|nr:FHA domain-containing protein [Acidobacteriota bacterium]
MNRYMLVYVHPELGEQRFELRSGRTYRLGSRSTADIVIPQRDVSRNHALLRVGEHGFHITDLGSKNGTYVNGNRVTSTELFPGDRLQLSSAELAIFEVSSGTFALARG